MTYLRNRIRGISPYFIAGLSIIFVWQLAVELLHPSPAILPTPTATAETLWTLTKSGELLNDVYASLSRVLSAWFLAAIIAIPLGLLQGSNQRFERIFEPLVELFRPISPLAWIPLAILWFGIGESGKIFVIFIATFFPILLNTVSGVKSIDPVMIRAGRILGCDTSLKLFMKVILPAAMPTIVVGLRIAFGTGWAAIIAAELVAARDGLGFLISNGMEILRSDMVLAGMVVIGVLGVLIDSVFRAIGKKVNWGAE